MRTVAKKLLSTSHTGDVLWALIGSMWIALWAQIAVELPFSPVPFTFQAQAVLILGLVLGPKRGALAAIAYLLEGAMGLPVFARACFGMPHLLGATGGYLLSYPLAVMVTGYLGEKLSTRYAFVSTSIALFAGNALVYWMGAGYLSLFIGVKNAYLLGVVPFLLADGCKNLIAAFFLPALRKLSKRA